MLRHEERLAGVHPDLARVVTRACQGLEVTILEGVRSVERARQLIAQGASSLKDPRSCRHVTGRDGFGHAVDLGALVSVDFRWEVRWTWPLYERIAADMKSAAQELGVPLEWGGDWVHFKDGCHFQLPSRVYP